MTERIAKISHGLKTFARDGEKDPMTSTSVGQVILETVEFCQTRLKNHGVQISQVLLNLLNNAFDAVMSGDKPEKRPDSASASRARSCMSTGVASRSTRARPPALS